MLLDHLRYSKTNFESGGLLDEPDIRAKRIIMRVPEQFIAPRRIDSRDMCLSSSNQQQTPHCAGYSAAGYIEFRNWKTLHYPAQVDGDKIYEEAKKIDMNNHPGTTLISVATASISLGLIKGKPQYVAYPEIEGSAMDRKLKRITSIKFALHQYGVVLAGFRITDEWDWVDKRNGMIRDLGDKAINRGGHAVLLCGYDDMGVYIQNSWSEKWGIYGFACLSWDQYDKQIMQAMIID